MGEMGEIINSPKGVKSTNALSWNVHIYHVCRKLHVGHSIQILRKLKGINQW